MDWNPNAPLAAGVEITDPQAATSAVASTPGQAVELLASTSEAIASLALRLHVPRDDTTVCVDVYEVDGTYRPWLHGELLPAAHQPSVDVAIDTTKWKRNNGGTAALYAAINEWPSAVDESDWIRYSHPGSQSHNALFRASRDNRVTTKPPSTPALDLTGRRVVSVAVRAVASNLSDGHQATLAGVLRAASITGNVSNYVAEAKAVPRGGDIVDLTWEWNWNPAKRRPWLNADLDQFFDTASATGAWGVRGHTGPTTDELRVYAAWLVVTTVAERRAATSRVTIGGGDGTAIWQQFPLVDPTSGASTTWAKQAGRLYWLCAYTSGPARLPVSWRRLNGISDEVRARELPLRNYGSGVPADVDSLDWYERAVAGQTPAFLLRDTTSALSLDSQPYYDVVGRDVAFGLIVEQEVLPTADGTLGIVDVAVRYDAATAPDLPLSIGLFRRSDGAQLGGTGTIDPADLVASPQFVTVPVRLASAATVAAGVQVAIRAWSSTPVAQPWIVAALDATDGEAVSYGGTTHQATVHGVDAPTLDVATAARAVPATPTGLAVTARTATDERACGTANLGYAEVVWSAGALGARFAAYEVARSEDGGTTWETIASIVPETIPAFDDYEVARNTAARYRVRVLSTDGAASDWTAASSPVTIVGGDELVIASNALGRAAGYDYDGTAVEWESLTAETIEYHQRWGIPMQVQLRPDLDRGLRWTRTLTVGWGANGRTGGTAAFADLLAWQAADVPYLAVLDSDGDRRYVGLAVRSMSRLQPGDRYFADVEFVDVLASAPVVALVNETTDADATYGDGDYGDGDYGT